MINISYNQIIPVSDTLARIKLRTIDNKQYVMEFMTEEDLKNMFPKVTVRNIVSIKRLKKVL